MKHSFFSAGAQRVATPSLRPLRLCTEICLCALALAAHGALETVELVGGDVDAGGAGRAVAVSAVGTNLTGTLSER